MHTLLLVAAVVGAFASETQTGYWREKVPNEELASIMTYAAKLPDGGVIDADKRRLTVKKYESGKQTVNLTVFKWRCDESTFAGCWTYVELRIRIESDGSAMAYSFPGRELPVEELAKGALGEFMYWSSPKRP